MSTERSKDWRLHAYSMSEHRSATEFVGYGLDAEDEHVSETLVVLKQAWSMNKFFFFFFR